METRTVEECRIWLLVMNPMRGKAEENTPMAISDAPEKLQKYMADNQLEEPVRCSEGFWHAYKEDGPLYWMNVPEQPDISKPGPFGRGVFPHWLTSQQVQDAKDGKFSIPWVE